MNDQPQQESPADWTDEEINLMVKHSTDQIRMQLEQRRELALFQRKKAESKNGS